MQSCLDEAGWGRAGPRAGRAGGRFMGRSSVEGGSQERGCCGAERGSGDMEEEAAESRPMNVPGINGKRNALFYGTILLRSGHLLA